MDEIRYDSTQFYPMKAVLEELFGNQCYMKLKETATFSDWKAETKRLLRAIEMAISTTVEIVDTEWREDVNEVLRLGHGHIKSAKTPADLFAHLSAILTRLVFVQLGQFPSRRTVDRVPLTRGWWRLNGFRSVLYIQTPAQAENLARHLRWRADPSKSRG